MWMWQYTQRIQGRTPCILLYNSPLYSFEAVSHDEPGGRLWPASLSDPNVSRITTLELLTLEWLCQAFKHIVGLEHRSLGKCSKHLPHWAISPVPRNPYWLNESLIFLCLQWRQVRVRITCLKCLAHIQISPHPQFTVKMKLKLDVPKAMSYPEDSNPKHILRRCLRS